MTTAGTATSPVETGQIDFATVDFLKAGASHPHRSGFRRLRQGADLHVTLNGTAASSAAGLPPLLKQGSYYIPAEQGRADAEDLQVVIGANVPTQLYLIWPALQDLPGWCYQDFDLVRGAEVKVCAVGMFHSGLALQQPPASCSLDQRACDTAQPAFCSLMLLT